MTKQELRQLIDDLKDPNPTDDPTFGIFQFGGGADESCIKANKQGLLLFAGQLLNAAKEFDLDNSAVDGQFSMDYTIDWIDKSSDVYINYVEFVTTRPPLQVHEQKKESLLSKLVPVGCVIVAIILVVALFIGLGTLIKWLF